MTLLSPSRRRSIACLTLFAAAGLARTADATWSIIVVDTRTKEVGIASATCLLNQDLRAITPCVVTGVGAGVGQSFGDLTNVNRTFIRDRLIDGTIPSDILVGLSQIDTGHQTRQYGIADVLGRAATFSGTQNGAWAGGQTGQFQYTYAGQTGTLAYAVQGNVLTGPGVVQAAVNALQTEGDVPTRLMAAMQAARFAGGDGRCSCGNENPTACGDPPGPFVNSSFIAFYIVARAGDIDSCNPVYPVSVFRDVVPANLFDTEVPEVITAGNAPVGVRVYRNTTRPTISGSHRSPPALSVPQTIPLAGGSSSFAIGEVYGFPGTGPDIVTSITATPSKVVAIQNLEVGTFGTPDIADQLADASAVLIGNLDLDPDEDVAAYQPSAQRLQFFRNFALEGGSPLLVSAGTLTTSSESIPPVLGDFDRNFQLDVAALAPATSQVRVYRRTSDFAFAPPVAFSCVTFPNSLLMGDFDGDGDQDLVTLHTGPARIQLHRNVGTTEGTVAFTSFPAITSPFTTITGTGVGDANGDGLADLAVCGGASIAFLLGTNVIPEGLVTAGAAAYLFSNVTPSFRGVRLADMDGDGDADMVARSQATPLAFTILEQRGEQGANAFGSPGTFLSVRGCAAGTYFMNYNVLAPGFPAPDPVAVLQQQFDAQRSANINMPDAVQTMVSVPTLRLGLGSDDVVIQLRNFDGNAVSSDITSVIAERTSSGLPTTSGSTVVSTGNGQYRLALTPERVGTDEFRITVFTPGERPIVLMPTTTVRVLGPIVCDSIDFNNDASLFDPQDIEAFLSVYSEGPCVPPGAACNDIDFNNDTSLFDPCDIGSFLGVYSEGPCLPCGF